MTSAERKRAESNICMTRLYVSSGRRAVRKCTRPATSAVLHWTAKAAVIVQTRCMNALRLITVVLLLSCLPACALRSHSTVAEGQAAPPMAELWSEAAPARDLFWGPGGQAAAP